METDLDEIIERYDGKKDIDVWLIQFDLYCELKNIPKEMQPYIISSLMTKDAADAFLFIPEDIRNDIDALKTELRRQFRINTTHAWPLFKDRKMEPNETAVDFMLDLMRLGRVIGDIPDSIIKRAFLDGLPFDLQKWLCCVPNYNTISLEELTRKVSLMEIFTD